MKGKHKSWLVHSLATLDRERLRFKIADAVRWEPLREVGAGCTVIIGACSKLPDVLPANLRCLNDARWPDLKQVIIVVDCIKDTFRYTLDQIKTSCPNLSVELFFYSPAQSALADALQLPFVYSWLSWCIALKYATTRHVLFHDYDALVLGSKLGERYRSFDADGAKVQGIRWYQGNGIEASDQLATTFEAFMDTAWLRSFAPIQLFNKIRLIKGRSIDCDTTLDIQRRSLRPEQKRIISMELDELVHPSQMICQYTMFQCSPAALMPCFSIPMIPFFYYLSGRTEAIDVAKRALGRGSVKDVELLGDGTRFNLSMLNVAQVDWLLKQIVQACVSLKIAPDPRIHSYGQSLYGTVGAPNEAIWKGDFTDQQRNWIENATKADIKLNPVAGING